MQLYVLSLYLCAGSALTLATMAWYRRPVRGAVALFFFLLCVGSASFAYAMNLTATELAPKLFWNHAEYLGDTFLPVLMLVLALVFTGREKWIQPLPLLLLFTVPVIALLANWTNAWHCLYYRSVWLESGTPWPILAKSRGPLYFLNFSYDYIVIVVTLGLIGHTLRRATATRRPQLRLLFAAFSLPVLLNLPYLFRLMPQRHINLTLLGFFFLSVLLSVGLFRFKLLAAIPIDVEERNELLLNHAEAIIYTITAGGILTYVSANWPRLLGHPTKAVVGQRFSRFVHPADHPACFAFLERIVQTGQTQTGIEYRVIHADGTLFWHTSSIRAVKDQTGTIMAYVGVAHDVTRLKTAKEELRISNKRLAELIASREAELRAAIAQTLTATEREAHRIGEEIHDTLCQELIALSRTIEIIQPATADQQTQLAGLSSQAARMAKQAREIAHEIALRDLDTQNFPESLAALAHRLEELFGIAVEVNCSNWPTGIPTQPTEHIFRIIREACGNAVKHGQATNLWIDIVRNGTGLVISVTNDGRPLAQPEPRPGLGLEQIAMRTKLLGGTFTLNSANSHTTAQLTVPIPETGPEKTL